MNKRKFTSGRGESCECVCHKRTNTDHYYGYCSRSHANRHPRS